MRVARPTVRTLDRVLLRAARPSHGTGRAAAELATRFGSGGVGWIGLTAIGALAPRTRPAARDGLLGWGIASGAALLAKSVTDRPRPQVTARGPAPKSSSMPSSHTAAAIGYAVAASLRSPAALPTIPIAVAVAWSRTANGRHYPTDIAAGVVLGGVVGLAVHALTNRLTAAAGEDPEASVPAATGHVLRNYGPKGAATA